MKGSRRNRDSSKGLVQDPTRAVLTVIALVLILSITAGYSYIRNAEFQAAQTNPPPSTLYYQNNTNSSIPNCVGRVCHIFTNQRISNFFVIGMNHTNDTVSGQEWKEYPTTNSSPANVTLMVGESVGYACDGTLANLTWVAQYYAVFYKNTSNSSSHGCPV